MRCLVTGATGYVGSRLIPELLSRGHRVRALARTPDKLSDVPWRERVEVVNGDLDDIDSLVSAFSGVDVVYYLVHSMGTSADFASEEDRAAGHVTAADDRLIAVVRCRGSAVTTPPALGSRPWCAAAGGRWLDRAQRRCPSNTAAGCRSRRRCGASSASASSRSAKVAAPRPSRCSCRRVGCSTRS